MRSHKLSLRSFWMKSCHRAENYSLWKPVFELFSYLSKLFAGLCYQYDWNFLKSEVE